MAMWSLAWQGSTPIGGPIVGLIGAELGPRFGLLIGGVPTILVGLFALPVLLGKRVGRRGAPRPDGP